jgi:hypothetical protein
MSEPMTREEYVAMQSEIHDAYAKKLRAIVTEMVDKLPREKEKTDDERNKQLRDYFAAHAPAEYLAVVTEQLQKTQPDTPVVVAMAVAAFMYADAMLAAREKP